MATNGRKRIMDIQPESIHERTPLVIGSKVEMEAFERCTKATEGAAVAR